MITTMKRTSLVLLLTLALSNLQPVPYSGEISFTKAGTVLVQAMNPDPDAADTPCTRNGYEAYYGTVDVNRRAGTFVMTVQSALVRDLIGRQLHAPTR